MKIIDLRSDTVTKPTTEMREVIATAEVGDDVFGDDPTVNKLQDKTAHLLGKEAALFVPSGTMANQVSIKAHTQPGDEVLIEADAHVFNYESGAPAFLSGVTLHRLSGVRGVFTAEQVEEAIRPGDHHFAPTRLVMIENTNNRAGGTIFPVAEMQRIRDTASRFDLSVHLDGARLWNASAATGLDPRNWTDLADSVSVCLSKGLGCPVGSLIAGSAEFIDRCHRYRKVFGGGMRQAGILAAAGIYALDNHRERMVDDHRNCRLLADAIYHLPGTVIDLQAVHTNILIVELTEDAPFDGPGMVKALKEVGVWITSGALNKVRLVTHLDVSTEDVEDAVDRIRRVWSV
ncbi:low-specificity L-threonine aldolase [candidate division LCP-89 bacterium B3_LCP]|uniref:Low-specificity L-threonine aldolase n=1 Tax=candidate division LCP-89 bacterium B3_LCP TaxID=2012998 RepID=A0A532V3Q0_UNCL8|nr:MAG: low-specificity L-threonine aldolase [candidate division LCP-89 bacterium B3_LCP]